MDPYERWRQVLWVASAVVVSLLTMAIVLTMMAAVFGGLLAGYSTPSTTTGY
jgi:hypothetical protein